MVRSGARVEAEMSCCKYRLDQSGRIENVPSESVLRVEARIDISPSGL